MATPIGNLGDLSPRAIATLRSATTVAAEDTRTSGMLVKRAGGSGRDAESDRAQRRAAHSGAARGGSNGHRRPCLGRRHAGHRRPGRPTGRGGPRRGVRVVPIPGPSALAAAVSASGFEGSDCHFLGFLPRTRGERIARLRAAAPVRRRCCVFFEAPQRLGNDAPGTGGRTRRPGNGGLPGVDQARTKKWSEGPLAELAPWFADGARRVHRRCPLLPEPWTANAQADTGRDAATLLARHEARRSAASRRRRRRSPGSPEPGGTSSTTAWASLVTARTLTPCARLR